MKAKTKLSDIFLRASIGGGAGLLGFLVLGVILLLTWSIVGDILAPTSEALKNEYGEVIEKTHPLFLSIVVMAMFLSSLLANLFYVFLASVVNAEYGQFRSTCLTQAFVGCVALMIFFLPVYLVASNEYGSIGVAFVAAAQAVFSGFFTFLVIEIISSNRSVLVGLYGVLFGLSVFFLMVNLIGSSNPTVMSLITFPVLLASLGFGSGVSQMFYEWLVQSYGVDFLSSEKRYGTDYGRAQKVEEDDDLEEWDI